MIDKCIRVIGHTVAWLVVLMVAATLYNVVARYWFEQYSIPLGELVVIANAIVFSLAAPLLLQYDQHVRVDVFYSRFNDRTKAVVDLFGTLFLLFPFCGFILYYSWGYVAASWHRLESSSQTGGLPGLYLVKSLIILVALLLVLQGIALLKKKWQVIMGNNTIDFSESTHGGQS